MLYRTNANAFSSYRFLTFFFFILMPGRKVRPSFILQTFLQVCFFIHYFITYSVLYSTFHYIFPGFSVDTYAESQADIRNLLRYLLDLVKIALLFR